MAVNDPNYRYATQTYEADGVRVDYEVGFKGGYIRQSDVVAFSVLVDAATGLVTDRQIHTVEFLSEAVDSLTGWNVAQVRIAPAVPEGRRVVLFRSTQKDESLVNYQEDSIITEKNLDLANQQAIFAIAEIMDGLNAARIDIDSQVQQVIDMNELTTTLYEQIIELLAAGGIVSVAPRVWFGTGNGSDTDFPLVGADVDGSGFYDTYVGGVGKEPNTDYSILMGDTLADTAIRFTTAPANGVRWFTVLRGYARPYTGPQPVTSLRMPVINTSALSYFVGKESEFAFVRGSNSSNMNFYVKEIPAVGDASTKMGTGSYVSFKQVGDGNIILSPDTGAVTLVPPGGYLPRTRTVGSVITITCDFDDANLWTVSGDLAKE